ncbi:MAG TPA: hypothetical protein VGN81_30300 [Pseudonocardiaceae bacterium]
MSGERWFVVGITRVEIGADTALRCVDCDRWDLREALLVDERGFVLLRGTACLNCRRHRAEDYDEMDEFFAPPSYSFG